MNHVRTLTVSYTKIQQSIVPSSKLRSPKCSLSFKCCSLLGREMRIVAYSWCQNQISWSRL